MDNLSNLEKNLKIKIPKFFLKIIDNKIEKKYVEIEILYTDPLKNKNFSTAISTFFMPEIRDDGSILLEDLYYAPIELIKTKIIPFACDAGGYFFCFDYRNNRNDPSIILWIRDNPEGYDIAKLANTFEEFVNNLKSEDEIDD